ncbi:MAG: response regulator, partial [Maricaulaceae bacterium]
MFQYKQPVLVVDEDAHMRALIASIMKNAGVADVAPASTVEDALREVHIRPPVAVITEANVGGRNGVALIDWLRRAPESPCPKTPALVLTGLASQSIVIRARDAGAHGVVAKPVAPETLIRKLTRAISSPRRFVRSLRYVGPCRRVRIAEGFFGRRLDDDDDDPRLTTLEHCERLAAPVNALANCASALDPTSRSQIIAVRHGARAVADEARAAQDRPLTEAADSLTGFVDACGL